MVSFLILYVPTNVEYNPYDGDVGCSASYRQNQ